MKAKLKLDSIIKDEHGETLNFSAVTDTKYGTDGKNDDNTFARWTPTASLTIRVCNPELIGTFTPGEKYYLDFTKA